MSITTDPPIGAGPSGTPEEVARAIPTLRSRSDRLYRGLALSAGLTTLLLMGAIGLFLFLKGVPALRDAGMSFFTETKWSPDEANSKFGIAAVMWGTFVIAVIALVIAVPVSLASALFISEYAPRRMRGPLTALVDLLAAVPSLIYGLWGFFYLQPRLIHVSRWLTDNVSFIPVFKTDKPDFSSSAFIAGVVVSLMVIPIATSVMRQVFALTPPSEKEGALALGGTRWGMIRAVVLPFGRGGIIGGSMLGLGRALGETIAVTLIISPVFLISGKVLQTGTNSVASLIALRFGDSKERGLSALMAAGFTLFIVTLVVNTIASVVVSRSRSGAGVEL